MTAELPLSIEERLARLEKMFNKLNAPPMDLLLQEGYFQIGSNTNNGSVRIDGKSLQINAGAATEVGAVWFVDGLQADPSADPAARAFLSGIVGTTVQSNLTAEKLDGTQSIVRVTAEEDREASIQLILGAGRMAVVEFRYNDGDDLTRFLLSGAVLGLRPISGSGFTEPTSAIEGDIWYDDTADQFKFYEGSTIKTLGGDGMTIKVKEADETVTSSTTLQNDDELWFAVAANEVWQFEGSMFIDTISSADFRFAVTGPSGAVGRVFAAYSDTAAFDAHVGAGDLGDTIDLQTTNTGTLVRFWGGIHNGANAGNLQVQWAQRVSQGTATTVHAGSYIKYQQANV